MYGYTQNRKYAYSIHTDIDMAQTKPTKATPTRRGGLGKQRGRGRGRGKGRGSGRRGGNNNQNDDNHNRKTKDTPSASPPRNNNNNNSNNNNNNMPALESDTPQSDTSQQNLPQSQYVYKYIYDVEYI